MIDLPPPLMVSEPGSFARQTIVERKPQIIRQVAIDNGYAPGMLRTLEAFVDEMANHTLQPLSGLETDVAGWHRAAIAHRGKTWLELPWYFAETYFYRRLLDMVGYFRPGPRQGQDPFAVQKHGQMEAAVSWLAENWTPLTGAAPDVQFEALLHACLWGNRADLSNQTVRLEATGALATRQERHTLLIDDTGQVERLLAAGVSRVDWVNDNTGRELLSDLALASFLLDHGWARTVVFHLKGHPFFVSDALVADVHETLSALGEHELGRRLVGHLQAGRLVLKDDPFWTTSLMFRQMPFKLRAELSRADLVILKGDVNYRRLLDDAHWPPTTPLEQIADYFPASLLVLRTLKGEIIAGLAPGQAEALQTWDPAWLINGQRGLIQLVMKNR